MQIKIIKTGIYQANCYFLIDEKSGEGAIIDPGDDAQRIISELKVLSVNIKYIILTHGHMDHTGAINEIRKIVKAPVYINKQDEDMTQKGISLFPCFSDSGYDDNIYIKDGDILKLGENEIKCIETPGHSPGGMSFYISNMVFTGDTLFNGSIGRTDFPGGNNETLIKSIKTKLMILDEDTIVYPGHGEKTSIGYEKSHNYYLS